MMLTTLLTTSAGWKYSTPILRHNKCINNGVFICIYCCHNACLCINILHKTIWNKKHFLDINLWITFIYRRVDPSYFQKRPKILKEKGVICARNSRPFNKIFWDIPHLNIKKCLLKSEIYSQSVYQSCLVASYILNFPWLYPTLVMCDINQD